MRRITGVIIVHESLTQSHDHLPQTPWRQQDTAAGPLDCSFSPNHFPAVHPGRRQRVMILLPFTCTRQHTSPHSAVARPTSPRGTEWGGMGGSHALVATPGTRGGAGGVARKGLRLRRAR